MPDASASARVSQALKKMNVVGGQLWHPYCRNDRGRTAITGDLGLFVTFARKPGTCEIELALTKSKEKNHARQVLDADCRGDHQSR
jgi:hypothetical protein